MTFAFAIVDMVPSAEVEDRPLIDTFASASTATVPNADVAT